MKPYDNLLHFEKLLDEFEQDALAAAQDNSNTPSASKRTQRDLTRRNIVAFVEGLALENDKLLEDAEPDLKEERDLLGTYLYDVVGDMSSLELSEASGLVDLHYCKDIIAKAKEYKE